jgi:hypothetical protein
MRKRGRGKKNLFRLAWRESGGYDGCQGFDGKVEWGEEIRGDVEEATIEKSVVRGDLILQGGFD